MNLNNSNLTHEEAFRLSGFKSLSPERIEDLLDEVQSLKEEILSCGSYSELFELRNKINYLADENYKLEQEVRELEDEIINLEYDLNLVIDHNIELQQRRINWT